MGAELLFKSFADTSFAGVYANDSFRVNVDVVGNKAIVSSLGTSMHDSIFVDHIVRVEFGRRVGQPPELPPFMPFAVYAGAGIRASDSVLVTTNAATLSPARVYDSSGSLDIDGLVRIANFRPAGESLDLNPDVQEMAAAASGLASLYGPNVRIMPHNRDSGNILASGPIGDGAPPESPFIWHIAGDLIVIDELVANGYVLVLVDGNVTIRDNIWARGDGKIAGESSLAIYTAGSVAITAPATVQAQLFAGENILAEAHGVMVSGSLSARKRVEFSARTEIEFLSPSKSLVVNWINPTEEITMISYDEQ